MLHQKRVKQKKTENRHCFETKDINFIGQAKHGNRSVFLRIRYALPWC